jgi:hypothetical protein
MLRDNDAGARTMRYCKYEKDEFPDDDFVEENGLTIHWGRKPKHTISGTVLNRKTRRRRIPGLTRRRWLGR